MLSISRKSAATTIAERMAGSRIYRKSWKRLAPSTWAASIGSPGTICNAARMISIVKGNHCQVSATAIAQSAVSGLVISDETGMLEAASARCSGLTSGVYRIFQIRAATIGGSTIGIRKTVRSAVSSRERRLSSRAMPRPSSTCATTVETDSLSWIQTDSPKRGSLQALR